MLQFPQANLFRSLKSKSGLVTYNFYTWSCILLDKEWGFRRAFNCSLKGVLLEYVKGSCRGVMMFKQGTNLMARAWHPIVRLGLKLKKVRLASPLIRSDSRETSPKTMNREMSLFRNVEAAKRRGIQSAVTHKTQKWFFKKKNLYFGKKLSRFLSFFGENKSEFDDEQWKKGAWVNLWCPRSLYYKPSFGAAVPIAQSAERPLKGPSKSVTLWRGFESWPRHKEKILPGKK